MLTLTYTYEISSGVIFTETCRFDLNTEIKQKYQLRLTSPYGDSSIGGNNSNVNNEVYLGKGITTYSLSNMFVLWDLQNNVQASGVFVSYVSIGEQEQSGLQKYLNLISSTLSWDSTATINFPVGSKIFNGGYQKIKYTLGESGSLNHEYSFYYNITPKYYELVGTAPTYLNYGIVVMDNSGETTNAPFSDWGAGYHFEDYYENNVGNLDTLLTNADPNDIIIGSGTGVINNSSGLISDMSPGGSVIVQLKSDGAVVGEVKVTMSRYYALTGEDATVTPSGSVLPFAHPTADGWGEGIFAIVAGASSTLEAITGDQGSLFSYESNIGTIVYSSALGCYVVSEYGAETAIEIKVKYMGFEIGTIYLSKSEDAWSASLTDDTSL
jgi:hypothetical protein